MVSSSLTLLATGSIGILTYGVTIVKVGAGLDLLAPTTLLVCF